MLGNLCPHIHCHLVLQFSSDDPHGPWILNDAEVVLSDSEYARIISRLRDALAAG